jgi:Domain of unknown function (DUF4105)
MQRSASKYATPEVVWELWERYRQRYLRSIVPDGTQGVEYVDGRFMGAGTLEEWWESAGMVCNRRIWAYQVTTTPAQDERLVEMMNTIKNRHPYHLKKTNCADFAAQLANLYFSRAVHHDRIADFVLMMPKQVVRSLSQYASTRPELGLKVWEIPQVPGSLRGSKPVRGGAEADVRQAEQLLYTVAAAIPDYARQFEQEENGISVRPILRGGHRGNELATAGGHSLPATGAPSAHPTG